MAGQEQKPIFDYARGRLEGIPGFMKSQTMIREVTPLVGQVMTIALEMVRTEEFGENLFIEIVTAEGIQRVFLPKKAVAAIYRHHDSIAKRSRKAAGKKAKAKAVANGVIPFETREDREARQLAESKA